MNKLVSDIAHGAFNFTNRSLIKNLIIITLCILLCFTLAFFPYQYYASANSGKADFQVGIHYVFEQDEEDQIAGQVSRIHDLGFKVIRITMECETNPLDPNNIQNRKNDAFFAAAQSNGMTVALVIKNLDETAKVDYYLNRWGNFLTYVQIFNEPELSSTWSLGAMFTDDEICSKFDIMYNIVESHQLNVQYYTNFGIAYLIRSNVPIELAPKLDFVGLDLFMDAFVVTAPHFIQNLQTITNRDVVITEFGMSTTDYTAQTEFILKGLNLFKNMGLPGCWLVYWNSAYDSYGIRDTPTETAVGEWIAANCN
jgi:hypothetical protein